MQRNLYDTHTQWLLRPADERFPNLEDLYNFTTLRRSSSRQTVTPLKAIHLDLSSDNSITMNGAESPAYFSHWAFGQLCGRLGAPASYLRNLTPNLAKECLEHGLLKSEEECQVLIRDSAPHGDNHGDKYASAFTGPTYGRIWDADVTEAILKGVEGTAWHVPPAISTHGSQNSGLYASDHDMFAFLVDDSDPIEVGNAKLGKGFFCWNSETGSSTFGLTTFLYNYVCGNHIVWGAEQVSELKIYHRSQAPLHFFASAIPRLSSFVEGKRSDDEIKAAAYRAMSYRIGENLEKAIEWFEGKPFTRRDVSAAWEAGLTQGEDVTTLWGMVQGLTAHARDSQYADKRVDLERRAGKLLALV